MTSKNYKNFALQLLSEMLIDLFIQQIRRQTGIIQRNSLHLFQSVCWDEKAELIKPLRFSHPKYKYFRRFAYITPLIVGPLLTWRCLNLYRNPGHEDKFEILATYIGFVLTMVVIPYGPFVLGRRRLKKYVHCYNATFQDWKRFQGKV